MAFLRRSLCKSCDQYSTPHFWFVSLCDFVTPSNILKRQAAALSMQEHERLASEEAEKRLKAALTAKRDPVSSTTSSNVTGSGPGPVSEAVAESRPATLEGNIVEDATMEVDHPASTGSPPSQEVLHRIVHAQPNAEGPRTQSPWLPELSALFPDIKRIAPESAYELIG
jgi:THO complex subunit 2